MKTFSIVAPQKFVDHIITNNRLTDGGQKIQIMEHFLTTEANLLAVDIASESYNFASNPRLDSASSKVLLRSSEAGSYLSELKLGRSIDEVKGACQERSSCESCGERFMYFCYDCRLPLPAIKGIIPTCKLPLRVDVIKHYKELNSKVDHPLHDLRHCVVFKKNFVSRALRSTLR